MQLITLLDPRWSNNLNKTSKDKVPKDDSFQWYDFLSRSILESIENASLVSGVFKLYQNVLKVFRVGNVWN